MKNKNLLKNNSRHITLPNVDTNKKELVAKITEIAVIIKKRKDCNNLQDGESGIAYRTYKTRSLEALNPLLEMYANEMSINEETIRYKVPVTEFYLNNHGVYYITLTDYCRYCNSIDYRYNNLHYADRDENRNVYWKNIKRSY